MTTSLSANQALAVVSHCPFPLLVFDVGGQVPGYNAAFEQLVDPVQACKLKSRDRLKSDQRPLGVLMSGERCVSWIDRQHRKHLFETHQLELPGEPQSQVRFFVDVGRQLEATGTGSALREPVLTAHVTGLLNQRGITLALEPQVARSERSKQPIAL
jgi:hypothetical protein